MERPRRRAGGHAAAGGDRRALHRLRRARGLGPLEHERAARPPRLPAYADPPTDAAHAFCRRAERDPQLCRRLHEVSVLDVDCPRHADVHCRRFLHAGFPPLQAWHLDRADAGRHRPAGLALGLRAALDRHALRVDPGGHRLVRPGRAPLAAGLTHCSLGLRHVHCLRHACDDERHYRRLRGDGPEALRGGQGLRLPARDLRVLLAV
mmetsp:Transcript_16918/g.49512  ORF Transcript_16918/g.49512 Transcript_16918/m.49512 type:complete len:207 (+) Transcript_16918:840-1460(+)